MSINPGAWCGVHSTTFRRPGDNSANSRLPPTGALRKREMASDCRWSSECWRHFIAGDEACMMKATSLTVSGRPATPYCIVLYRIQLPPASKNGVCYPSVQQNSNLGWTVALENYQLYFWKKFFSSLIFKVQAMLWGKFFRFLVCLVFLFVCLFVYLLACMLV